VRATLKAGPAKLQLPAKVRRTKGTYTVALAITDAAGNTTTTKTTFRVK
jgi:PKD repeat protein